MTLFIHDRDGRLETLPDSQVLNLLLEQVPLVTRNPDGSRTFVFDLVDPGAAVGALAATRPSAASLERLRSLSQAMAGEARELGLMLTAALSESAELVAEAEISSRPPKPVARS